MFCGVVCNIFRNYAELPPDADEEKQKWVESTWARSLKGFSTLLDSHISSSGGAYTRSVDVFLPTSNDASCSIEPFLLNFRISIYDANWKREGSRQNSNDCRCIT